ncbi:hypothetical protein T01_13500 [Trichinella spiralis]|uniref:Uncharacterized protein n=1 Tax=Trichinella spiralis TaxID=6334 RepID=A0A0V0Z1R4_TRISP|nr:hypothetical protein T01_13500 [Trichinella spiralis]
MIVFNCSRGIGPTSVVFHGSLISRLLMPRNLTTALKRDMQTFLPLAQCQVSPSRH